MADEDFDARIIRGLRRRLPTLDLIPCQKIGLRTAHDRVILESQDHPIRAAIDELEFIAECGEPADFADKVIRLPL